MSKPPRPLVRHVYVIGPKHGLQKVGIAIDPASRLTQLQTGNPVELLLHASIPVPFRDAHAVERIAHTRLDSCRVRNEWFETTPAEAIVAVHSAAAPFVGRITAVPDPTVVWPSVASWRIERDRGLPLFDHVRDQVQRAPEMPARARWWERVRRALEG